MALSLVLVLTAKSFRSVFSSLQLSPEHQRAHSEKEHSGRLEDLHDLYAVEGAPLAFSFAAQHFSER